MLIIWNVSCWLFHLTVLTDTDTLLLQSSRSLISVFISSSAFFCTKVCVLSFVNSIEEEEKKNTTSTSRCIHSLLPCICMLVNKRGKENTYWVLCVLFYTLHTLVKTCKIIYSRTLHKVMLKGKQCIIPSILYAESCIPLENICVYGPVKRQHLLDNNACCWASHLYIIKQGDALKRTQTIA